MTAAITFFAFIAIAGFLFFRMFRSRDENPLYERIERPKRTSARERKLAKLKEFDDAIPARPTIQELLAEEVRDTGVDQIPGGDGLEIPTRLKVWHRDAHVRARCAEGGLRFVVKEGVDPASASQDDVLLLCEEPAVPDTGSVTATNDDVGGDPQPASSLDDAEPHANDGERSL